MAQGIFAPMNRVDGGAIGMDTRQLATTVNATADTFAVRRFNHVWIARQSSMTSASGYLFVIGRVGLRVSVRAACFAAVHNSRTCWGRVSLGFVIDHRIACMYRDDLRVPFALAKHDIAIKRGLTRAHIADAFRTARLGDGAGASARLAVRVTANKRGCMTVESEARFLLTWQDMPTACQRVADNRNTTFHFCSQSIEERYAMFVDGNSARYRADEVLWAW
jgi:hypothetical protein